MFFASCVYHAFTSVNCCLVVTCWEMADLMTLVGDCIFCYFSMWYPGSGVVLDRIVSRSLPAFLLKPFCIVPFHLHCLFNFVSDTPFYFIFILRVRHFEFKYKTYSQVPS